MKGFRRQAAPEQALERASEIGGSAPCRAEGIRKGCRHVGCLHPVWRGDYFFLASARFSMAERMVSSGWMTAM